MQKQCRKCGWEGPSTEFIGRQCKACKRKYAEEYRKANRDRLIAKDKEKYQKNRDKIRSNYDHPNFAKCWALENLRPYSAKENCLDGVLRIRHGGVNENKNTPISFL